MVWIRRLVLASRGLTGLLNPCVKSGTKLFQSYFLNCFNCASPLRRSSSILEAPVSLGGALTPAGLTKRILAFPKGHNLQDIREFGV